MAECASCGSRSHRTQYALHAPSRCISLSSQWGSRSRCECDIILQSIFTALFTAFLPPRSGGSTSLIHICSLHMVQVYSRRTKFKSQNIRVSDTWKRRSILVRIPLSGLSNMRQCRISWVIDMPPRRANPIQLRRSWFEVLKDVWQCAWMWTKPREDHRACTAMRSVVRVARPYVVPVSA